jgi:hypothetical protein
MKNYLIFLTSLGLWAGSLPALEAQPAIAPLPVTTPAPETPDDPGYNPFGQEPPAGYYNNSMAPKTTSFFGWTSDARDGEGPVSVVTFKAPDQKTVDETAEDLNVLSLIFSRHLERALGEEGGEAGDYKLGIPMLLQTGGRWVEASYIEGFGAVFNLKVRFPLVSAAAPDKDTPSSQLDSEWEQARRALAGGTQDDPRRQNPYEKARRFNPNLVETLKKRVVELLRNASNLRHVQPEEWVAVTFSGPPNDLANRRKAFGGPGQAGLQEEAPDAAYKGGQVKPKEDSDASQEAPTPGLKAPEGTAPPGSRSMPGTAGRAKHGQPAAPQTPDRATVMTIRIKKKDADAFAGNKMSEDQFFHAAEITSYLGPVVLSAATSDYFRIRPR